MRKIDINCDLAELEDQSDLKVMPFISSCNIACGAHAGSQQLMELAIEKAIENEVTIGAHPGYPDKPNFGRISMPLTGQQIENLIVGQVTMLHELANMKGAKVKYVKLHGALYHDASSNKQVAESVINGLMYASLNLPILGPPSVVLEKLAQENGINYFHESFIDRKYQENGNLVPRIKPGAVLETQLEIKEQLLDLVLNNRVITTNGKYIELLTDSICIHGDHPGAAQNAQMVSDILEQEKIDIRSFVNLS